MSLSCKKKGGNRVGFIKENFINDHLKNEFILRRECLYCVIKEEGQMFVLSLRNVTQNHTNYYSIDMFIYLK